MNDVPQIEACPAEHEINGRNELRSFFDTFIAPNLPDPQSLTRLHGLLKAYVEAEPGEFVIRDPSKGIRQRTGNLSWFGSDNEAALWFWVGCRPKFFGRFSDLGTLIRNQAFPIGHPRSRSAFVAVGAEWRNWGIGDSDWPVRSQGRWKHCHVYNASVSHLDLRHAGLRARMVRLLHPLNHFLFPTPFVRGRGGYVFETRGLTHRDPGEDPLIRALISECMKELFGEVVAEFKALIGIGRGELPPVGDAEFWLRFKYVPASASARYSSRMTNALALDELYEKLVSWYAATNGQPDSARLDGRGKGTTGGVAQAVRFEVTESTNAQWNYNTVFQVAGDTQRGAIRRFLELYEGSNGAYSEIFAEVGRSKNGTGKRLKLALIDDCPGWQVLSMSEWTSLEIRGR